MPRGARSYMGLGVSSRCIIVECEVMSFFFMQSFVVAPLPIRSYVGLGMNSRCIAMNMNLNLWRIFGQPTPTSQRGFWGATPMPIRTYKGLWGATPLPLGTYEGPCVTMDLCTMHPFNMYCIVT